MGRRRGQLCVKKQKIQKERGGEDVGLRVRQENAQLAGEEPRLTTLFFYHMNSRNQTQVTGLGGKSMYLLSHLLPFPQAHSGLRRKSLRVRGNPATDLGCLRLSHDS